MKPEERARKKIDKQLKKANWTIQDYKKINLGAATGVAVRDFPANSRNLKKNIKSSIYFFYSLDSDLTWKKMLNVDYIYNRY